MNAGRFGHAARSRSHSEMEDAASAVYALARWRRRFAFSLALRLFEQIRALDLLGVFICGSYLPSVSYDAHESTPHTQSSVSASSRSKPSRSATTAAYSVSTGAQFTMIAAVMGLYSRRQAGKAQ